jgi:hypothetical protein
MDIRKEHTGIGSASKDQRGTYNLPKDWCEKNVTSLKDETTK